MRDVRPSLQDRVAPTLKLALSAWAVAASVGVSLGVFAAFSRATALDCVSRWLFWIGKATPPFFVGVLAIILFSPWLEWPPDWTEPEFPTQHYALVVIALASVPIIMYMRFMRLAVLDALDSRLVAKERARGVGYGAIVRRYAARRVLASALATTSQLLPWFVTGIVVMETFFWWPGLGRYIVLGHWSWGNIVRAVAILLIGAIAFSGAKLILDILRRLVDPKMECAW